MLYQTCVYSIDNSSGSVVACVGSNRCLCCCLFVCRNDTVQIVGSLQHNDSVFERPPLSVLVRSTRLGKVWTH